AAARFGDATLIVTPGGPPAEVARSGAASGPDSGRLAAASALALELAGCRDLEAAARAVLAAMEKALAPKRGFVLLWDRAQALARPLVGRSDDASVSISRTVLGLAAQRRRAVRVEGAGADARAR